MKTDLGVVKVGSDNKVEVDVPSKDEDIDHEYDRVLKILAKPRPEEKQKRDASTKQEDYYKSFRTRVVLAWLISNLALIIGILHSNTNITGISVNGSQTTANIYLTVGMVLFVAEMLMISLVECCCAGGFQIYWIDVVFDYPTFPRRVNILMEGFGC
jgi:chitin synthase